MIMSVMAMMSWRTLLLLMLIIVICTDAKRVDVRPPRYRTLYACEGSSLEIVCEEGTHINLIRANFGRFSISVCNDNGNVEWSVDCMSHRSFRVMQESCGMKRSCKLPASSNVFGDPCLGTLKYLEAHYQCMPDYPQLPYSYTTPRNNHSLKNPINPLIPSYDSNDRNYGNSGSSPNPRIIFPESYNPSPVIPFPAVEMDSKQTEVSDTETVVSKKTTETNDNSESIESYPRLNENDIPPPINPPLISDNETPVINSDNGKPIVISGSDTDKNENSAHQYSSTFEPKWINKDSDFDSINTNNNKHNNNNNFDSNTNIETNSNNEKNIVLHQNHNRVIDLSVDHCQPRNSRGLFWNWTLTGYVANQSCPGGAKGLARWACTFYNGSPHWSPMLPDMSDCSSLWITHLETRINSGTESVVSLADELAKSCKEKILFGGDLFRATDIINQLVSRMEGALYESHEDQQRRSHFVKELLTSIQDIVSNLLDDNQMESWNELSFNDQKSAVNSMLNGLERMALLLADTKQASSDYIRAHHNIFVSVHIRSISAVSHGLHLPPIVDTSDELPNGVTLNSNSVYLPQQTLTEYSSASGLVKVVFLMYKKLAHLLKPEFENSDHYPVMMRADGALTPLNISRVINSEVIGILLNRERYTPLSEPIEFTLKHLVTDNMTNPKCVFWDIDRRDWSDQGCLTVYSNVTHTTCKCNHLTNFAILMDVNNIEISSGNELALRVITLIGCTVSIVCLSLTFITLVSFRSLRGVRTTIHTNLCLCLIIAELVFILGINQTKVKLICGLIACALHYFFLASFLWMFFEGFQLYVMLIEVFDHQKSRINWYYLLSYGVPAILVIISAIIDPLSYGTSKYCWLRSDNYFIWAFVGPVIAILMANIIFLSIALTTMCRHIPHITSNKTKEQTKLTNINGENVSDLKRINLKVWIRGSLALVFLLGITWSFGLLYISSESLFMAYLFTITNSCQGLFIFIFNCLINEKVRTEYRKLLNVINLKPICLESTPSKSVDTSREHMPSSSLSPEHRTSLYVNNTNTNSNPKDSTIVNVFPNNIGNTDPLIIGNSTAQTNGLNMSALMVSTTESPKSRRLTQKYYLTDDSSDYGCKRLQQNRCHKQSCRDIYALRSGMSSHSPNFIEHIYECIDEDPYVAKLLLPAIQRSLDGQHVRTLSDSSRHSDNRPLISCPTSSPRGHNFHIQGINTGSHLPAIVKDNTSNKTTIICSNQLSTSSQPTVALLNGNNQVICCTLNDHQLCDHNNQSINGQLRQQYLVANSLNNLNLNCMPSKNRHLSSDC